MAFINGNSVWKLRRRSGRLKGSKPWNTGQHLPQWVKNKISKSRTGSTVNKAVRNKIRKTMLDKSRRGVLTNGFKKGMSSPKSTTWRHNMSIIQTANWRDKGSGFHSSRRRKKLRLARLAQKFLQSNTSIELKVGKYLSTIGVIYLRQYQLGGRFLADFYVPTSRVVIECDGDYWHSLTLTKLYDRRKAYYCRKNNIRLLRLKEKQIHDNFRLCCLKIQKVLHLKSGAEYD